MYKTGQQFPPLMEIEPSGQNRFVDLPGNTLWSLIWKIYSSHKTNVKQFKFNSHFQEFPEG